MLVLQPPGLTRLGYMRDTGRTVVSTGLREEVVYPGVSRRRVYQGRIPPPGYRPTVKRVSRTRLSELDQQ